MRNYIILLAVALFGLTSFSSKTPIDDKLIGKWQLKGQILVITLADGTEKENRTDVFNGASKEYKADGTFEVHNTAGPYISGAYSTGPGQIYEHVKESVMSQLVDSRNKLSYSLSKDRKQLITSFRLPGMTDRYYKEIWERKGNKVRLQSI